jgi:hypothetical protein
MRAMFARTTGLTLILAALFATPAAAQPALTLPLKDCYVVARQDQREQIDIHAVGFTPLRPVELYIDDILQYEGPALADGSIEGLLRAPYHEEGSRPFELRIAEAGRPANTIVEHSMVTRLAITQTPSRASTNQRVRFKGRGFMNFDAPVYAHYVFAGKVRKSVRLAVPTRPCGGFTVRRKQFPFKKAPKIGTWTIQFDQNPHYDPKAAVRVPMTIKVRRTPKQASARAR